MAEESRPGSLIAAQFPLQGSAVFEHREHEAMASFKPLTAGLIIWAWELGYVSEFPTIGPSC
jgi:hypothetical protein